MSCKRAMATVWVIVEAVRDLDGDLVVESLLVGLCILKHRWRFDVLKRYCLLRPGLMHRYGRRLALLVDCFLRQMMSLTLDILVHAGLANCWRCCMDAGSQPLRLCSWR